MEALSHHDPRMFFTTTGESIDIRVQNPIFAGIIMQKVNLRKKLSDGFILISTFFRLGFTKARASLP